MSIATAKFSGILWGFAQLMKHQALHCPKFRAGLKERNLIARGAEAGRWFQIKDAVRATPPRIEPKTVEAIGVIRL